ncbi:MAG: hypothetical protein ACXVQ7_09525, partial [Actinomycetota bacterium]
EAAMNAMPMDLAQQLVADRRASYEGFAARRALRRLARRPVYVAAGDAPVTRREVVLTTTDSGADSAHGTKVSSAA